MRNSIRFHLPLALGAIAMAAGATDTIRYAEDDGTIRTAVVEYVRKDTAEEFNAAIRVAGRKRTLKIPGRQVVEFWRGSSDDVNQWAKGLAKGRRMLAAGQLATTGNPPVPGAEELFERIAYSTEKGTPGSEEGEAVAPWHNMYALYYLIETRYRMGQQGNEAKYGEALQAIEQFHKRTDTREGKTIDWEVPAAEGLTVKSKIYGWGDTRLSLYVSLYEARIHSALGETEKALSTYDALIDDLKKKQYSPLLLADATLERAAVEAKGTDSQKAEQVFRAAGNTLSSLARTQKDQFGKDVLRTSANQALLRGADLLLDSAMAGKVSFDVALNRYLQLREGEGRDDPALMYGAMAGMGICLVKKGEGERAYDTLLEVATGGANYPRQAERALFYLSQAAPLFADEVDRAGGDGGFLRAEAQRWMSDLKQRFPGSQFLGKEGS
jgi:tetratricopeptide (TPR) repeat protein